MASTWFRALTCDTCDTVSPAYKGSRPPAGWQILTVGRGDDEKPEVTHRCPEHVAS